MWYLLSMSLCHGAGCRPSPLEHGSWRILWQPTASQDPSGRVMNLFRNLKRIETKNIPPTMSKLKIFELCFISFHILSVSFLFTVCMVICSIKSPSLLPELSTRVANRNHLTPPLPHRFSRCGVAPR